MNVNTNTEVTLYDFLNYEVIGVLLLFICGFEPSDTIDNWPFFVVAFIAGLVFSKLAENAFWTKGESWSLGDSPAIALALNPDCGHFQYVPAPVVAEDTSSVAWASSEKKEAAQDGNPDARPMVKMYTDVDSRYILEDLIAKLELFCEQ